MNDQDRPDDESRFDDPADAWVRDLLAEARVSEPVPDDVAARLDATLASLRAERVAATEHAGDSAAAEPAVVVPLRRRLAPLLAAAAAVVVIAAGGVGVVNGLRNTSDSDSNASSSAADSAETAGKDGRSLTSQPPADALTGSGTAPDAGAASTLPRLSTTAFAADAARVMRSLATAPTSATADEPSPAPTSATPSEEQVPKAYAAVEAPPVTASPRVGADLDRAAAACAGPPAADAVTVPATLDGASVALVFRPPTATAQRVEAWSCDGATLLASASVPH